MLRGNHGRYLSPREFAEAATARGLPLATRTVQEWAKAGRLRTRPGRKPGERLRIVASELPRLLEENGRR